jgi:hypothetical protein
MKSTNSKLPTNFSWRKVSLLAFVSASVILGGCKKNSDEAGTAELTNLNNKNAVTATTSAAIGSGWTEITSAQEATQMIHLQNDGSLTTENWNGGADTWYLSSSNTLSSTQNSSSTVGYSYASSSKTHTFTQIKSPSTRSEIRVQDNYGPGTTRQFEGVITI